MKKALRKYFLPYQVRWIEDPSRLKIIEKSRQIGITHADSYDSVMKASTRHNPADVWVTSRDLPTANEYIRHCLYWSEIIGAGAQDLGEPIIDQRTKTTARVLRFKTGHCIYSLSSNPNAFAGKTGHIKLDEFALHSNQAELYRRAKPCTTWGGQLSIISTHRDYDTVFNQLIRDIHEKENPMGWSLHRVTIHDAVAEGLVEKINQRNNTKYTREQFVQMLKSECIDDVQWHQDYCCQPAQDISAFIPWPDVVACQQHPTPLRDFAWLRESKQSYYIGVDVARREHLTVIDVGQPVGDVVHDRLRIELRNAPFSAIEAALHPLLKSLYCHQCCIDQTGLGCQLAERARAISPAVIPVTFTPAKKQELAYRLRIDIEQRRVALDPSDALAKDLTSVRRIITENGHETFSGYYGRDHADRFWAKALRQQAYANRPQVWAAVA